MTDRHDPHRHWMQRDLAAARGSAAYAQPRSALSRASRWGFLLCAAVAAGYGLWALYGSGTRAHHLDLTRQMEFANAEPTGPRVGPLRLDPGMNPLRAVLHSTSAPVGSTRLRYEVSLEDADGRAVWSANSALGSHDDEASVVMRRVSLATFSVQRAGDYYVRARTTGSSLDDLREATLELRREVLAVDSRITWGFGLAALAFLITSLLADLKRPGSRLLDRESPRRAA